VIHLDDDVVAVGAIIGDDGKVELARMFENIGKVPIELVRELTALWTLRESVGWPHAEGS
jgi:hypothetical protein